MTNKYLSDPLIVAYIAARRTERSLDRTRALARQWRGYVSTASNDGDDIMAVEALQYAQRYNDNVSDLHQRLAAQEAEVTRLHQGVYNEN